MKLRPIKESKNARKTQVTDMRYTSVTSALAKLTTQGYLHGAGLNHEEIVEFLNVNLGEVVLQPGDKASTRVKVDEQFSAMADSRSELFIAPHSDLSHSSKVPQYLVLLSHNPGSYIKPTGLASAEKWFLSQPPLVQNDLVTVKREFGNSFENKSVFKSIVDLVNGKFVIRFSTNGLLLKESSPVGEKALQPFDHALCDLATFYHVMSLNQFCAEPTNQLWCYLDKMEFVVIDNTRHIHFVTKGRSPGRDLERWVFSGNY